MTKSIQSVCKRTRSRSKPTSLLDFDVPKNRPATTTARTAVAAVPKRAASATLAEAFSSSNVDTRSSRTASKRGAPTTADSQYRQPSSLGGTAKRAAATTTATEPPAKLKATTASNKRRRVAKPATANAANNASAKQPRDQPHDDDAPAKTTRSTVCVDADVATASTKQPTVVAAKKPASKKLTEKRKSKKSKRQPQKVISSLSGSTTAPQQEQSVVNNQQQWSVTPSPDLLARKMAAQKNAAARSVTIDPLDTPSSLNQASNPSSHQKLSQLSRPAVPAFHQPWQQPYTPCLAAPTPKGKYLPSGVIDIDLFPHQCCAHSLQSHGGYSWITSERRCGCVKDSNHCSGESLTEVYLGTYGAERYSGGVGMAGSAAGLRKYDWKTEQWWIDQTRKEKQAKERNGQKSNLKNDLSRLDDMYHDNDDEGVHRMSSPTSTLSDASSISGTPPHGSTLSKSKLSSPLFSHSMLEHLDYMPRQPNITIEMRRILMDWLLEVAEEYKLSTETFWLSVALVDRSLACSYEDDASDGGGKKEVKKSEKKEKGGRKSSDVGGEVIVEKDMLQLVGCACTLIASKLVEITPPEADDYVYISDKTYTRKEIIDMEATVCNALKFNLNFRTPYHYVDRFLRASYASSENSTSISSTASLHSSHSAATGSGNVSGMNNANNVLLKKLVFYLLDLAVLEYKLVSKPPSLVAASAVYLARATLGIRQTPATTTISTQLFESNSSSLPGLQRALKGHWSKTLEHYTGYDIWDLEEPVKLLHRLQETAEDGSDTSGSSSIFNKHKGSKCKRVALTTVVNEAELGFL